MFQHTQSIRYISYSDNWVPIGLLFRFEMEIALTSVHCERCHIGSHMLDLGHGCVRLGFLEASQASSGKTSPTSFAQCTERLCT